jgi:predicted ferric reductase
MDPKVLYAINLGGILVLLIIVGAIDTHSEYIGFKFRKYILYRNVMRHVSWIDFILITTFMLANFLYILVGTQNVLDLVKRSGFMAAANFVPLFLGSRINHLFKFCGATLSDLSRFHRWVGRFTITLCLAHALAAVLNYKIDLGTRRDLWGLVVSRSANFQYNADIPRP